MKAICMYAAIRPVANFQRYIQEPNADTGGVFFDCNRHCDHDEDDDTSSQYEDPLECVICSAFCEWLCSQDRLYLLRRTVLISYFLKRMRNVTARRTKLVELSPR